MTSKGIRIDKKVLNSEVFRSLSKTAMLIYLDFLQKRKMQKIKGSPRRSDGWIIINNGEIEYTYSEAEKRGISRSRFMRALDGLIGKGFIDVAHSGSGGMKGDKSKYAISERWREWGTDNFINKTRPRDTRGGRGFGVYWKNQKANMGIKSDNPPIIENDN